MIAINYNKPILAMCLSILMCIVLPFPTHAADTKKQKLYSEYEDDQKLFSVYNG